MKTCRNGLHNLTPENTLPNGWCRPCRQVTEARKRERRAKDPKAQARRSEGTAKTRAWHRFERVTTPTKKFDAAVDLLVNGWAKESDSKKLAEGITRARLRRNVGPEDFDAQFARASDEMWKAVDRLMAAEKKNPLKHLDVKPEAERAWDRFDKALKAARLASTPEERKKNPSPNCQDRPAEFVDFDEEDLPTSEEAYRLCDGCPLKQLCSVWVEQERPAWGVWAGEVWVNGEIVNNE